MENEWRQIPNTHYAVSIVTKEGQCKNLITGKVLSNRPTKRTGRITWNLQGTVSQAARWIAFAYPELIENEYFEGAHIDHKDTDVLNNHPSNLRWVTPADNNRNPLTRKHSSNAHKGKHPTEETREKLRLTHKGKRPWMLNHPNKSKSVCQYDKDGTFIREFPSTMEAQRQTGIERVNIMLCCKNRRPSAGGYVWNYS